MDPDAKAAIAVGTGILIGKLGGSLAWWALGASGAIFLLKSPETQRAIRRGAESTYAKIRKG